MSHRDAETSVGSGRIKGETVIGCLSFFGLDVELWPRDL